MANQFHLLIENQPDQSLVIFTAPASPQWWQGRKRSYLAIAELAPQTLDATDTGRLAPQVTARIIEAMAPPARGHVPQVHVSATPTANRTLEPWPANSGHRLVPHNRNASFINQNKIIRRGGHVHLAGNTDTDL